MYKKANQSPNVKRFFQAPIQAYQYLSRMLPGSCRYYPTCSEYAKWQFEFNAPHKALLSSSLRILRCNQLFPGGIDYPIVQIKMPICPLLCKPKKVYGKIKVNFWVVPKDTKRSDLYYIIKDIYDSHLELPA